MEMKEICVLFSRNKEVSKVLSTEEINLLNRKCEGLITLFTNESATVIYLKSSVLLFTVHHELMCVQYININHKNSIDIIENTRKLLVENLTLYFKTFIKNGILRFYHSVDNLTEQMLLQYFKKINSTDYIIKEK